MPHGLHNWEQYSASDLTTEMNKVLCSVEEQGGSVWQTIFETSMPTYTCVDIGIDSACYLLDFQIG